MTVKIRQISPECWLGQRLREHRKTAGLSQASVAAKLKWQQSYVSKVEAGETRLAVVDFVRHCSVIGADPASLVSLLANRVSRAPPASKSGPAIPV
jgi:transcriptional regulator with XRE-family HTH domain